MIDTECDVLMNCCAARVMVSVIWVAVGLCRFVFSMKSVYPAQLALLRLYLGVVVSGVVV